MTPTGPDRRSGEEFDFACEDLEGKVGDDACDKVLLQVCRANTLGVTITIWDLPQLTGLPLHAAFAAVRALEFGRLLTIGDNPSDPFGATLRIEPAAADRLRNRRAA